MSSRSRARTNVLAALILDISDIDHNGTLSAYILVLLLSSFVQLYMASSSSSPEIYPAEPFAQSQSRFSYKEATQEEVLEDLSRFAVFTCYRCI